MAAQNLELRLDEISRSPVLLVATDFDGTLAPIVSDPDEAEAHREALVALKALAGMPQTHAVVLSGRALADLALRIPDAGEIHLVGSHGSEFEAGLAARLPRACEELLHRAIDAAQEISNRTPGSTIEIKPASLAFHYRNVEPPIATAAVGELLKRVNDWSDLFIRHGKMVVELSVVKTDKGQALQSLRQRFGATAVLFLGDDTTDEDALATLAGPDVGIKVGHGATVAPFRVRDTVEATQLLVEVAERRAAWLAGSDAVPIERHSLLSDQRTFALVDPNGRVAWMCLPRLDSAAIFAELLGGPSAGFFEVRPVNANQRARQEYAGSSFVLLSDWGSMRVLDYLDCSAGRPFQRAGRSDLIRVIEGQGRVRITFAPRLNFGGVETHLRQVPDGVEIEGAIDPCVLIGAGIHWTIERDGHNETAVAELDLGAEPLVLELRYGTANQTPSILTEKQRREQTQRFWSVWAATLKLPAVQPELVLRSALALRALTYGPTGAIAAAATTSLPEHAGGVRNWDYRFCWPRDAALAASALARLGAPGPAMKLLDWILGLMEGSEPSALIRPVYSVTGGHLGAEGVIAELAGYRGSRPVRVGNGAAHQIQLDVLGPVAELLALAARQGAALTPEHWRLTLSMVDAVRRRWKDADHGIWEIRGPRQHHVHSKVMCWQTVDCAIRIADYMGMSRQGWDELRAEIAAEVLLRGWNRERGAFCSHYDGGDIDAATLCIGLSGLLPPDDSRFISTVHAVERELLQGGTVYRYRYDDGLPGIEGGFNLCTAWLIECYALLGQWQKAEELFTFYLAQAGPTGLMAEEYDPRTGRTLGNFPQAYSHIGLINVALRLASKSSTIPR